MVGKVSAAKTSVVLLGPALGAVSGVSTHLNLFLSSGLADEFSLHHFQVGREGRVESRMARAFRFFSSPFAFARYLHKTGPAIVHLNTSINRRAFWRDLAYLVVARAMGRKTVYQVHGGELPEDFARSRASKALMRWVLGLPQAIVLLARSEANAYRKFVPAVRLEIIPNAIDVLPSKDVVPRAPSNAPLRVVYMGRLVRAKGIFETLQAVHAVRIRGVSVETTFAGDGPDAAELRAAAMQLGINQHVRFVGPVFGEEKRRLWTEADVFAFPTLQEGLPYALLESMAFGVVPIATPVGAIPDVMVDGLHGLLVPAQDPQALAAAICRLDGDRAALQRMSQAGQQRIREHYTLAHMARQFQSLYESL